MIVLDKITDHPTDDEPEQEERVWQFSLDALIWSMQLLQERGVLSALRSIGNALVSTIIACIGRSNLVCVCAVSLVGAVPCGRRLRMDILAIKNVSTFVVAVCLHHNGNVMPLFAELLILSQTSGCAATLVT